MEDAMLPHHNSEEMDAFGVVGRHRRCRFAAEGGSCLLRGRLVVLCDGFVAPGRRHPLPHPG